MGNDIKEILEMSEKLDDQIKNETVVDNKAKIIPNQRSMTIDILYCEA